MASITKFLEKKLKLRVNREKSAVAPVWERKFLGHRLLPKGGLGIAPKSIKRMKERVKEITRRNRGVNLAVMIRELNVFLTGWVTYFRYAKCKSHLRELDGWIRRKLRCVILKQCKGTKAIADFLRRLGTRENQAWMLALSGKGWWRLSNTPQTNSAMSSTWFEKQGLVSLTTRFLSLQS
jgi:RNA-directed DNA polymerase